MLVLTRKPGEVIVIDGGIKITVVAIKPGRVRLGIEAPESVRVDRQEVHERIEAAQTGTVTVPKVQADPKSQSTGQRRLVRRKPR